jgi:hypothetical protein
LSRGNTSGKTGKELVTEFPDDLVKNVCVRDVGRDRALSHEVRTKSPVPRNSHILLMMVWNEFEW